jgi:hypothetical protein
MGKGNKQVKKKKQEIKSKKKKSLLIISIIVLICIIGILWFVFNLGGAAVKAQLIIESGFVDIKHEGDDWLTAENGMILYQSDIIRTGNNTEASVVLFESSIIRLDSNTEIILKELITEAEKTSITIQQNSGRTWNTVLKVSGIDDYEVQTPTTVASVRGTSFDVYIQSNTLTDVGVGRGVVVIFKIDNDTVIDSIELKMNEAVSIYGDNIDQILKIRDFLLDDWVLKNQDKDEGFKSDVKAELYDRIEPYIDDIKERWDVTDDEFDVLLTGYVNGNFDLPPDTPGWIIDLMELS